MMALADLDEILIRATYSTDMVSASIAGVSMETAVPAAPGLPPAPEVEECRCPPGYRGLSCQDCAPGYTRTGGGLYLGHCELCECNGHSDTCHPETGACSSPAYTLVWTRQNHGKLPSRAMDFNGILTIRNVQPEDAGVYVCTGSNMLDMDEGTATLYVQAPSKTQMFYGPVEFMEGHRPSSPAAAPSATVEPAQLSVAPGQPAEFRCVATGSPTPTVEWLGGAGGALPPGAVVQGSILRFPAAELADESHYLCRARNSAGQHTARAFLRVQ
ncbi:basement membrane-specific heparan sulfate proteoglycan core protein-like, partial [Apteryx rowi]|uniref:basement membrane-specific heparan sulfate proteoglycan core protein-like n=1 Tax=Apteryx rowi TaxID=308060 RepID=UPI000E1E2885